MIGALDHGRLSAMADPPGRSLDLPEHRTMTVIVRVRAPYAQILARQAQAHGRLPDDIARDLLEAALEGVGV